MKKIIALVLALVMVFALAACGATAEPQVITETVTVEPTAEEYAAWAEANGYVKAEEPVDMVSSATDNKQGGVNYGAIEWSEELQVAAVKEWLKGGKYLGDASYAQDETGFNYREMFQMATCYNNVPTNTNLELVLDADTLHLIGISEAGTGKTLQFMQNPAVSVSWCKQLRLLEEEDMYNYYCSYGLTFNGNVKVYTAADLETEEGQAALLNLFDKYYPTLSTSWAGYAAGFAQAANEDEVRAAKLEYITKTVNAGTMVAYEIIPTKIVITAPFLMNMVPQMSNAVKFTTVQDGADKYAYTLDITDEFIDMAIAYKNEFLSDPANVAAVTEYYSSPMFQMLDQYCAQYNSPTSLDFALMDNNLAGLKTQTTYIPAV